MNGGLPMHEGGISLPNYRETWNIRMIKSHCVRKARLYTPCQRSRYPNRNDATIPCESQVM